MSITLASTEMAALIILPCMTCNVTRYVAAEVTVGEPRHKITTHGHRRLSEHPSLFHQDIRFPHLLTKVYFSCTGALNFDKGIYLHF